MVGVSRLGVATAIHPGKAVIIVSDVMNSELSDEAQVRGEECFTRMCTYSCMKRKEKLHSQNM